MEEIIEKIKDRKKSLKADLATTEQQLNQSVQNVEILKQKRTAIQGALVILNELNPEDNDEVEDKSKEKVENKKD